MFLNDQINDFVNRGYELALSEYREEWGLWTYQKSRAHGDKWRDVCLMFAGC